MITRTYIAPFQGLVTWRYYLIPLYGMFMYEALSGSTLHSPERASYNSEGATPLATWASYNSEGATPLANKEGYSPSDKTIAV
jgi:hypothetical protein